MQRASTITPPNELAFQASRSTSFNRHTSRLNPLTKQASVSNQTLTTWSTRTHLSNLQKLLQKQVPPPLLQKDSCNGSPSKNKANNLFKGLNLSKIWPEKEVEEMSPQHLNRLQRLLSMSAEHSPRNNLGSRWRGLSRNLRREVVRFGEFIQAAYHTFHSSPAMSEEDALFSCQVELPDRLPSWVDDLAPDFGWMTQRSSWIGYVAVCDDEKEISRMGRRNIIIALRGTATCLEWAENMRDVLVRVPGGGNSEPNQPAKVECGFLSLFKTPGSNMPSLAESVIEEVRRLMELYKGETLSITVTGHSLGAALALLTADELSTSVSDMPPIAVFSFGGPRVGNRAFADRISKNGVKVLRIVNSQDVITRVPGMFVSEEQDQKLRDNSKVAKMLIVMDNMPWAYAHVGTELRVDSKMSPYLKSNANVACYHDLEAYLHLVDGFMGSNCPFRGNAKRSFARSVNERGSEIE
ncbi:hypothetical protein NE237_011378 [Protea cynaroides]|uniref:Fungal lipase-type domain-containing protein n=1 Tax=Protea cynaroides TaxID=273540 RepID=A0A9Q0GY25_9MAGN|nr:hypothetical protein NE237_011378 [Protea cynaroides]